MHSRNPYGKHPKLGRMRQKVRANWRKEVSLPDTRTQRVCMYVLLSIAQHGALLFIFKKKKNGARVAEQYEACTMPIQLLKSDVKFYDWLGMTWNKNNYICKDRLKTKIENENKKKKESTTISRRKRHILNSRCIRNETQCRSREKSDKGENNFNCVISIHLNVKEFRYVHFFSLTFLLLLSCWKHFHFKYL